MGNSGRTFAQRYSLDVQIASSVGTPMWRALDKVLNRWVTVYLLDASDPRCASVVKACLSVAANGDREAIAILDVIEAGELVAEDTGEEQTFVGVITEWAEGAGLQERLLAESDPFDVTTALDITRLLAAALDRAHSKGIAHGRLRPHNVMVSDTREIRLDGFGIDRSILGPDDADGFRADIRGVGNLLFTMVTGLWPHGLADGLPAAPKQGPTDPPSSFRGAIPASIDELYIKTQNNSFGSMRELVDALSVGAASTSTQSTSTLARLASHPVQWHGRPESKSHRVRATSIALACVLGMGWVGWQLLTHNFNKSDVPVAIVMSPLPTASLNPQPSQTPEIASLVGVKDYDPFGNQTENPDKASLAIDGDPATAWTTVNYLAQNMAGKPGVGLMIDLGAPRPVSQVTLTFDSPGMSATVYVTDSDAPDITTAASLGQVDGADTSAIIKAPRAISGRYVLVWITHVPKISTGNYQGGIAEVQVGL